MKTELGFDSHRAIQAIASHETSNITYKGIYCACVATIIVLIGCIYAHACKSSADLPSYNDIVSHIGTEAVTGVAIATPFRTECRNL